VTVSVAVLLTEPSVAVMVAFVWVLTALVVTVKVPVVAPDATVTEAGTCAAALFDASVTVMPLVPAAESRVTVPVLAVPPITDVGLSVTLTRLAGRT